MTETGQIRLANLEDSDLVLAHAADDVRGRTVVDPNDHRVGEVDGLIIDEDERRARQLIVGSGGILGSGRVARLVPVDAVANVAERVELEVSHESVHAAPEYDLDDLVSPRYHEVYVHYGYTPFWEPRYVDPYFLRRL